MKWIKWNIGLFQNKDRKWNICVHANILTVSSDEIWLEGILIIIIIEYIIVFSPLKLILNVEC